MKEIIKRLQIAFEKSNFSYADFSKYTGIPKSALQRYITGSTEKIPMNRLESMAYALGYTPQQILGWTNSEINFDTQETASAVTNPLSCKHKNIPLVGQIACGKPLLANQNIEEYITIPEHCCADFALLCKGDSMIDAGIQDGDIVYIRRQPNIENGEIAAVRIQEEATLKRVYKTETTLTLMPANPAYPPLIYAREQMNEVIIEGKAIGYTHWYQN